MIESIKGQTQHNYIKLLLTTLIIIFSSNSYAYCTSQGKNVNYEWISHTSIAGISNNSGANNGYADFTNQVIELNQGSNDVTLSPGFRSSLYTEYWKIWIDFNRDNTFTEDESVFSGSSQSTLNGSFTIPAAATNGHTRMRVTMKYGGIPQPCESFTYGEVEDYTVSINTTDTTSPIVITKYPSDSEVEVSLSSIITLTFSEEIDPLSVNNSSVILSYQGMDTSGEVNTSGNVLTFTPDQPLEHSTQYTVTVYSGLLDLSGNPLLQDEIWSFTTATPDLTPPTITQVSPQDGELDVDINQVVSVLFSESMDTTTINEETFTINDGINNIAGSVVMTSNRADFYTEQPFDYSTNYSVTIAASTKDIAGNALGSDYTWNFTSREFQLDYCSSFANNTNYMWISAVKVGSFTASSPSQPYTGYSNNTSTVFDLNRYYSSSVTLTPGYSSYAYTTSWNVFIDWNKDGLFSNDEIALSGSNNTSISGSISVPEYAESGKTRMRVSMQYSSSPSACGSLNYGEVEDYRVDIPEPEADITAPEVSLITPNNGSLNIPINAAITVAFSESMDESTLTDYSLVLDGGTPVSFTVSYDDQMNQAVFTPTSSLEYNTNYTGILSNEVSDVSGNSMVNEYVWSFTTQQEPGPTYNISGSILEQGFGVEDVAINITGATSLTILTDSSGAYSSIGLSSGTYTVTPTKAGYSFAPESLNLTLDDSDISSVGFTASIQAGALVNSDFETGDFSGFNLFTTSSGHVVNDVVNFDTNNDGVSSNAARFNVGTNGSNTGYQHGGGIYQTVTLIEGDLSVTVDIAATANSNNGSGGLYEIYFDGELMDTHDFGSISAGANEYDALSFNISSVEAGTHELRIQMTRPYNTTTVANYVDDITLTGSSTQ